MSERWPRLMKLANAAAYCDMTVGAFEREVLAGRLPAARVIGGKDHWDKAAIDRAIDILMGNSDTPDYRRKLRERYGEAA